jgi:hypothetical protein
MGGKELDDISREKRESGLEKLDVDILNTE